MSKEKCMVICVVVAAVIIAIISISLIVTGLRKINSDEVGLKYNPVFKVLSTSPTYEGLHTGSPGFLFIKFPSVYTTLTFRNSQCLNRDGVQTLLSVSYQYRVKASALHAIVTQFQNHENYKLVLYAAGLSSLHAACSDMTTVQFQSERGRFQEDFRDRLVVSYDELDCDVTDLQVNNIIRPKEYESAIRAKEGVREEIEVAKNENPRLMTEAETTLLKAETQAQITLAKAASEARVIQTRATSEAEAIKNEYYTEAASFKQLKSSLNLNPDAFLSYVATRVVQGATNPVYVGMQSPAKTSYFN